MMIPVRTNTPLHTLCSCARLVLVVAIVASRGLAGGAALDLDGATFALPTVKAKASGKSPGVGKGKGTEERSLSITLANDAGTTLTGTFTTELDGEPFVAGAWSRSGQVARKLSLEVVTPEAVQGVEDAYEQTFEEVLADNGVLAEVFLALIKQKGRLVIQLDKKAGTARASLQLSFRFEGSGNAPVQGVIDAPLMGRGRLKGKSDAIELAGILASED